MRGDGPESAQGGGSPAAVPQDGHQGHRADEGGQGAVRARHGQADAGAAADASEELVHHLLISGFNQIRQMVFNNQEGTFSLEIPYWIGILFRKGGAVYSAVDFFNTIPIDIKPAVPVSGSVAITFPKDFFICGVDM